MLIVPKFGEFDNDIQGDLLDVIDTKLELQMITKDLFASLANCFNVISNILKSKALDEVVLHLPFSLHTFEIYVASPKHRTLFRRFLGRVESFAVVTDIKIGIIFHQECSLELIETIPDGFTTISDMCDWINTDLVYYLVENCLPCLNAYDTTRISAFDLLQNVEHEKLNACVDVCHSRCFETVLGLPFLIPKDIQHRVKWIHFAGTLNHDGFRDKNTHGRVHQHPTSVLQDLTLLADNGVNIQEVPLCTEISEKDYKARTDMLQEIELLKEVNYYYSVKG